MAETIKIASLAIDSDKLIKSLSETKTKIDDLTKSQAELKKAGDTSSETFIKNEAALKNLKSEYTAQSKVLQATSDATEKLTTALGKEIQSVDQASTSNKELKTLRNQLNTSTEEGAEALTEINKKIDANNNYIKENASELEQQKIEIGAYSDGIKNAANELNPLNGGISGLTTRAKEAGGVIPLVTKSLQGMAQGVIGMTKASLTFLATPIGAVIAVLGLALGGIIKYLTSTQAGIDKVTAVTRPLQAIFQSLIGVVQVLGEKLFKAFTNPKKLLTDLVSFIETNVMNRFKAMGVILEGIINLDFKKIGEGILQGATGVEDIIGKTKTLAKNTAEFFDEAAKKGADIDRLQKEIEEREGKIQSIRSQANDDLRKQENIYSDLTKSAAERNAAADEAKRIATDLEAKENEILDRQIEQLKIRQSLNDTSREENAQLDALIAKRIDSAATLDGIDKKTLAVKKSVATEGQAAAQKAVDNAIKLQQEELALYIASQGTKARTLQEQLTLEQKIADDKIKILDAELAAKKISQTKYDTELLNIKQGLLDAQTNITIDNAQRELDAYADKNQSKIDSEKFLSDEIVRIEEKRLNDLAQKQRDFAALQLAEGIINKTQYDDAINAIDKENNDKQDSLKIARKEAERTQEEIDLENKRILDEENFLTDFQIKIDRLELERKAEVKKAEDTGADIDLVNQIYDARKRKLEEESAEYIRQIRLRQLAAIFGAAAAMFNGIAGLLEKESAAHKAVSIAAAIANVAQGVTQAIAQGGLAGIFTGIAVAAAGAISINKIVSTKPPKIDRTPVKLPRAARGMRVPDSGGMLQGNSHASGGIDINAEGGEAIINKRSTSMFAPLLSEINAYNGNGVRFAKGGIVGSTSKAPSSMINYEAMAESMAIANRSLPAPIVAVDEISRVTNRVNVIETNATF